MTSSWEALRKEARRLENDVDAKLVAYAKLGHSNSAPKPGADGLTWRKTSGENTPVAEEAAAHNGPASEHASIELEQLLVRLSETVEAMSRVVSASPSATASMRHMLERHTEILNDYKNEFRKTKGSIMSAKEHQDLLSSVRQDMVKRGLMNANGSAVDAAQAQAAERAAIAGATSGADAAVGTGLTLREELERQRAMFASMVERMETVSESVPSINRLIGQIRRKRKRDVFILAGVIAFLAFITFLWKAV